MCGYRSIAFETKPMFDMHTRAESAAPEASCPSGSTSTRTQRTASCRSLKARYSAQLTGLAGDELVPVPTARYHTFTVGDVAALNAPTRISPAADIAASVVVSVHAAGSGVPSGQTLSLRFVPLTWKTKL